MEGAGQGGDGAGSEQDGGRRPSAPSTKHNTVSPLVIPLPPKSH